MTDNLTPRPAAGDDFRVEYIGRATEDIPAGATVDLEVQIDGSLSFKGRHAFTLPEFVLARIAEDEADLPHDVHNDYVLARLLGGCKALRAIVERHEVVHTIGFGSLPPELRKPIDYCHACGIDRAPFPCPDVRALAGIWSDHPDYRQEWAL